ncbi:hypothetical protein [Cupriavidus necator]|uniref:hypothetical protein n=1 Tax=Cupriavidus necator TaxID=106590 RepID=UPI000689B510|nr:hypothetical protein [Cupriavidus necator]
MILPPAIETFKKSLARLGGTWCEYPEDGNLEKFIRARFSNALVICSATLEVIGTRRIDNVERPHDLNDVDVGVVRPAFAVAETPDRQKAGRATSSVRAKGSSSAQWSRLSPDDSVAIR